MIFHQDEFYNNEDKQKEKATLDNDFSTFSCRAKSRPISHMFWFQTIVQFIYNISLIKHSVLSCDSFHINADKTPSG